MPLSMRPRAPVPRGSVARHLSSERGGMTEAMYNWRVAAVENALKKMGKETGRPLMIRSKFMKIELYMTLI